MLSEPQPVVLIIADISGYTRFMVANAHALTHAQAVISELIETIIKQVEIPLQVSKLEGDAVFLYAIRDGDEAAWDAARKRISERLFSFFDVFQRRVAELATSTSCTCGACTHIDKLRLKVIVHRGQALLYDVAGFRELAGVDVIVVHRLLKNGVDGNEYVLLTEPAYEDLGEAASGRTFERRVEPYDDVGDVPVRVWRATEGVEQQKQAILAQPALARAPAVAGWTVRFYGKALGVRLAGGQGAAMAATQGEMTPGQLRTSTAQHVLLAPLFLLISPFLSLWLVFRQRRATS